MRFIVIDMPKNEVRIYNSKAVIYQNDYDKWQFRMWLDLIEQAEANSEKVNNYALAKQVGIEVEQRNTEEEWDVAYKRRVVSVAVSRKKKVAVDAIKSIVNGVFPS